MSTQEKVFRLEKKDSAREPIRDNISHDETRVLWLGLLHGMTLMVVALRKYLRVERCDTCGK